MFIYVKDLSLNFNCQYLEWKGAAKQCHTNFGWFLFYNIKVKLESKVFGQYSR